MSLRSLRTVVRMLPLALLGSGVLSPTWAQIARLPASAVRPLVGSEVEAGTESALPAQPALRVLLAEGGGLLVAAPPGQLLQIRDGAGRPLGQLAPGQELRFQADRPGLFSQPLLSAPVSPISALSPTTALSPTAPLPQAEPPAAAAEIWLEPADRQGVFLLQQRPYRGALQVRRQGAVLQAINHVPLEAYLPSVVGSEMPASWPQPALRAQAVAARTYALRQRRPEAAFDLQATVASQVYRGVEGETASTREAVAATRGLVLTYGGSLIEAVFHSSSGGSTEASGEVWNQQLPYLVAVPDFDDDSPVRTWQERFEPAQLRQAFAETGGVGRLEVIARTSSGRVRQVLVTGPQGSLVLSGAQLRKRLGLRSTSFDLELVSLAPVTLAPAAATGLMQPQSLGGSTALGSGPEGLAAVGPPPLPPVVAQGLAQAPVDVAVETRLEPRVVLIIRGRGFGHGIGMSQWGAYGLARRGADYTTILSHYYPGTQLNAFRDP